MKRYLPFALMFVSVGLVYACSSSDETTPTPDGGASSTSSSSSSTSSSGGEGGTDAPTDSPSEASSSGNVNPIEGVGNPTAIAALGTFGSDGLVYRGDALFLSDYGQRALVKFVGTPNTARTSPAPYRLQGTTYDEKNTTLVTAEAVANEDPDPRVNGGNLVRTAVAGGTGTPITLTFVSDAGALGFDSPNDLVARKDGTLYVTDPGYQGAPTGDNHIWRVAVSGAGGVTGVAYETPVQDRPNGIALSPDEKTLFVGFTDTAKIRKYVVNTDGSLGAGSDFITIQGAAPLKDTVALDGITVDSVGNIYAATKGAVIVFKPDGTQWGKLNIAGKLISSVALGGADKKTLFIGTNFNGVDNGTYQATVKVAGK